MLFKNKFYKSELQFTDSALQFPNLEIITEKGVVAYILKENRFSGRQQSRK